MQIRIAIDISFSFKTAVFISDDNELIWIDIVRRG